VDGSPIYVKNTFIDIGEVASFKPWHNRCRSMPGEYPHYAEHPQQQEPRGQDQHGRSIVEAAPPITLHEASPPSPTAAPPRPSDLRIGTHDGRPLYVKNTFIDVGEAVPFRPHHQRRKSTGSSEWQRAPTTTVVSADCGLAAALAWQSGEPRLAPCPEEVPSSEGLMDDSDAGGVEHRTTVMIRGLPVGFMREILEGLFDREGFTGCYDFVYVPIDIASGSSFYYAFVNLVSPTEARRFFRHFTGFNRWPVSCDKEAAVEWSENMQGLSDLIGRYRNSPLMHDNVPDALKPAIYQGGRRAIFPAPTKGIRAPRVRLPSAKKAMKLTMMHGQMPSFAGAPTR